MKMDAEHAELVKMLKYTHLSGLLSNWERYLEVAKKEDFSHVRFLKYIVEEEYLDPGNRWRWSYRPGYPPGTV